MFPKIIHPGTILPSATQPPISSNNGIIRNNRPQQQSTNRTPSLPREGAQHLARQIGQALSSHNADFMKTPDGGMAR